MGGLCTKGHVARNDGIPSRQTTVYHSLGKGRMAQEVLPMPGLYDSGELRLSESRKVTGTTPSKIGSSKVPEFNSLSLLGRAGTMGLEKAVDVLDTLGSSMSNLNHGGGFISGMTARGTKLTILAFEVANTIVKGAYLMQSLSEENIQFLKNEILPSDGVQRLVSTDMEELLTIAGADKREELDVFSREVVRFGDLCKDPQWHNLDRYFQKLNSHIFLQKIHKEEAERTLQQLVAWAKNTSELYHELHTLDRLEQDYHRKVHEDGASNVTRRGEGLMILHSEVKRQRRIVKSLKKKSLWSKNLEELMGELVDIVTFLCQKLFEVFGNTEIKFDEKGPDQKPCRLGTCGLALHYANLINQIDNIVARPNSFPPNTRDTLYHALPSGVKIALRSKLQSFSAREELTVSEIKAEMEKTLQWIVPMATDTIKAHQGFGWVGEWANISNEFDKKPANNVLRIQTLHHAQKDETDEYILELVTWLHQLVIRAKHRNYGLNGTAQEQFEAQKVPLSSLLVFKPKDVQDLSKMGNRKLVVELTQEEKKLLEEVNNHRRFVPGISKSQRFESRKERGNKLIRLSRSCGSSPNIRTHAVPELGHEKFQVLDVMDGLKTLLINNSLHPV